VRRLDDGCADGGDEAFLLVAAAFERDVLRRE